MMRTMEPGKWCKTGAGTWVAKTDSDLSFKMVARMRCGAIYAAIQDDDGGVVSVLESFGGFASSKDAKAWCDSQWARTHSFSAKARHIERMIAGLQRRLDVARQMGVE